MTEAKIRKQLLREIKTLKDRKGFLKAGLPRFDRLFGRDSLISAWQLLNFNPGICKATLKILSKFQGRKINELHEEEPGKIIHETDTRPHPEVKNFPFPYYGSIDSTPLYLIIFSFYFRKTKNIGVLRKYWKNVLRALDWMEKYGDLNGDGFLEYQRKNPRGCFHQGWKDGFRDHLKIEPPVAIVEVQGYQYLALKEISNLARMRKDLNLAKKLEARAESLKEKFNKKFWMKALKYFALALDGKKEQKKAITSNPGHLLFTGVIEENKVDLVAKRLFKKDLFTPYGIRTYSALEPDFDPRSYHSGSIWPHDNWIIAQGLKKLGYKKEYLKIKNALLRTYQKLGLIPEFYGVIDNKITLEMEKQVCHPQAWASGALLNFLQDF